ncbi:cysteine peptidase family C39 domain-containing protein [Undibacterium sp. Ji67W]|uniref:cysteine peptidase family C39 domain-containing protein n=1 Tax=Undibacterium sp. Ji67W TaxID=3413042 RepID=UPI003BF22AE6
MKPLLQTESSECGLACLAMITSHYGHHLDLADLSRQFAISLKGATLAQLMRHASALQLSTRPLGLELDELSELQLQCILHWNLNHFVVLKKVAKNWQGKVTLTLLDPAVGERQVSLAEASTHFTGVALELLVDLPLSDLHFASPSFSYAESIHRAYQAFRSSFDA